MLDANIFPLIVAQDDAPGLEGVGGTYTLFLSDQDVRSITPVPPQYAMLKSLSHMPLGIFTILGPSFKNLRGFSWVDKLEPYASQVSYALGALDHSDLGEPLRRRCRDMLSITHEFVTGVLERRSISLEEYSAYTAQMLPFIHLNLDDAARIQAHAVTEAISRWRQELGPELWRQLYVVIPTVWPVSRESPRQQIFRRLMDPEEVDNRLIIGEGVRTIDDARTLLGRIVSDRLVGRLVFTPRQREKPCVDRGPVVSQRCCRRFRPSGAVGAFRLPLQIRRRPGATHRPLGRRRRVGRRDS